MQKLIADYLFQHKRVALPGVGTLEIRQKEAVQVPGEKIIRAPVPEIYFTEQQHDASGFVDYITADKHISHEEAGYLLDKYCEEIRAVADHHTVEIPGAGNFQRNNFNKLTFIPVNPSSFFLPGVPAEKVIRTDSSHAMLVGDKETSTAAMAEYYNDAEAVKTSRRYLWIALILLVLSAGGFVLYLNDEHSNTFFGINHQYEPVSADSTYQLVQ